MQGNPGLVLRVLMAVMMLPWALWASSVAPGRSLEILNLSVSARDLAIGESAISATGNAFAALYNPATLAGLRATELYSYHGRLAADVDVFSATVAHPISKAIAVSFTWTQYQTTGLMLTDVVSATPTQDINTTDGTYSTHALTGAISATLTPAFHLRVSATGWVSRLATTGTSTGPSTGSRGIALTPGFTIQFTPNFGLGARLANALSAGNWDNTDAIQLAPLLAIGVNWQWQGFTAFACVEADPNRVENHELRLGSRYQVLPFWSISVGSRGDQLSVGTGVSIHRIRLEYGYVGASATRLESGSRVTVGVVF